MSTETLRAHCGACAGRMILHVNNVKRDCETGIDVAYFYGCLECGTATQHRRTAAAAADDVVWVPAKQRRLDRLRDAAA